jgi:diguanylate cyclase (GGDEF)-like protein
VLGTVSMRRLAVPVLALLLLAAIAWADIALFPADLATGLLYLIPVAVATWWGPRWSPWLVLVVSLAALHVVDLDTTPFLRPSIAYWNLVIRGLFFASSVVFLGLTRAALLRETRLAATDPLTGALNVRRLHEELEREIGRLARGGVPFALGSLDLDDFKQVNDRLGHLAGDRLLRDIVATLRTAVRRSDLVARVGGDEFALLLPATDETGARRLLGDLRARLRTTLAAHDRSVSFSAGAVVVDDPATNAEAVLHRADELMYAAKRGGKDTVVVTGMEPAGDDG